MTLDDARMTEPQRGSWSSARPGAATTDIVLLRHGDTRLTPERRFSGTGSGDPGLSATGGEQIRRAARGALLRSTPFAAVVSSPLRRCQETAALLAAELQLPVKVEVDLREADFGDWEGLTLAEVERAHPLDLAAWQRSADVAPTGSSETFGDVLRRVGDLADRLAVTHAGSAVLAVSHVTPIKAFVAHALGASAMALFKMELSSAALTRITCTGPDWLLRSFNDTSHLT
ncbi:MAG: FIG006762: Phosphoglycerate mutase family [uncultured Friedmanniella sp.]|uniref:FIG006762: Phosphoglycerate mutase family n=1 Tax=uncultured Friedmanniella sp. TaxID=335381 RepID=A0A6J4LDS6_9ACTN|nr:MAG: FIG006762: Phosphoglycerate mutase family [uncultured Friedmanniella sp.]